MANKNNDPVIDKKALHDLYTCHWQQNVHLGLDSEEFQAIMEPYLAPYTDFLFHILPQCPRLHTKFFEDIPSAHLLQVHALANLCGVEPPRKHPNVKEHALPDIKLSRDDHGQLEVSTFSSTLPHISGVTRSAVEFFWDNFTLEEMRALSDKDQANMVALFEQYETTPHRTPGQHMKLAYGLHLPQELLDYNTHCLKELAARIIIDENFHDALTCFMDKIESKKLGLSYIEKEEDKRRLTNTFMNVMAQIWQIPDPVEQDYKREPTKDKNGVEFSEYMHAFYVAAANDNDPGQKVGLIYGANTHNGYLNGDRRFAIQALSHEFGHLLSNFIVSAYANTSLIDAQKRKNDIRNSPALTLSGVRETMSVNNMYAINGRYYSATSTIFNGLNTSKKDHIYKGQLEERHADWLGNKALEYIDFALDNRDYIDDFEDIKCVISNHYKGIMAYACPDDNNVPELFQTFLEDMQYTNNFDELEDLTTAILPEIQQWVRDNFKSTSISSQDPDVENPAFPDRKNLISAYQACTRMRHFCDTFFDVRRIVLDYGYEIQTAPQNTLTAD